METERERHTPGPWFVGAASNGFEGGLYKVNINADGGFGTAMGPVPVANAICWKPTLDGVPILHAAHHVNECDANARLIAAAPELLAACKATLNAIDSFPSGAAKGKPLGSPRGGIAKMLRAAIARATNG